MGRPGSVYQKAQLGDDKKQEQDMVSELAVVREKAWFFATLHNMAKRHCLVVATAGIAFALHAASAVSQPARQSVKIVVPYSPGGEPDRVARILANELQKLRQKPVFVENKEGASGALGIRDVMNAAPDGRTLLVVGPSYTLNASLLMNPGYDPSTSLAPVILCCTGAFALTVHPSISAHNVKDFAASIRSNPGKFTYASAGAGTPFHMAMELFANKANVELTHIPYKGMGGAVASLVGGHVNAMFLPLTLALSLASQNKVRLLAMTGQARSKAAPELPTFSEEGYADIDVRIWIGALAPPATPSAMIGQYNADLERIISSQRGAQGLAAQHLSPSGGPTKNFADFIAKDTAKWQRVAAERRIQKH